MLSNVTVFCFLASYTLALALEAARTRRGVAWLRWPALLSAAAGLLAHTAFLLERSRTTNLPPLLSSTQDWLLVVAWVACVLYLFLVAHDRKAAVGLFLLPAILLLVGASYFVSDVPSAAVRGASRTGQEAALRGWAMLHAALLGLGIVAVVAGVAFSLMYLVQHRRLRDKRGRSDGITLLSLERLARWNRLSVIAAVPLLTLGFLAGFILGYLAERRGGEFRLVDPVVLASGAGWLVMVLALGHLLTREQATGRTVAVRTLLAFGFLLATMIGLQVVTGGGGHAVRERDAATYRTHGDIGGDPALR